MPCLCRTHDKDKLLLTLWLRFVFSALNHLIFEAGIGLRASTMANLISSFLPLLTAEISAGRAAARRADARLLRVPNANQPAVSHLVAAHVARKLVFHAVPELTVVKLLDLQVCALVIAARKLEIYRATTQFDLAINVYVVSVTVVLDDSSKEQLDSLFWFLFPVVVPQKFPSSLLFNKELEVSEHLLDDAHELDTAGSGEMKRIVGSELLSVLIPLPHSARIAPQIVSFGRLLLTLCGPSPYSLGVFSCCGDDSRLVDPTHDLVVDVLS